jgi:predicted dehydrogenase
MSDPLRWGLLGCGSISRSFARDVQLAPGNELVAVGSRDPAKAAAFAAAHCPQATAHGSYAALVADPRVQAVYIATPHSRHAEDALLAIAAGKSVLVEKAFALNRAQAEQVLAAASAAQVFCGEAMWTRFLPVMAAVRGWIRAGRIGRIERLEADFSFAAAFDPASRLFAPDCAGGALLDVGCYVLGLALDVANRAPDSLRATARFAPNGVDAATTMVALWEPEGLRAQLSCGIDEAGSQAARIVGSTGVIDIPSFWSAKEAILHSQDGATERASGAAGFQFEISAALAAIRAGAAATGEMPHAHTLALMGLMDQVRAQIGLRYPGDG